MFDSHCTPSQSAYNFTHTGTSTLYSTLYPSVSAFVSGALTLSESERQLNTNNTSDSLLDLICEYKSAHFAARLLTIRLSSAQFSQSFVFCATNLASRLRASFC